MAGDRLKIEVTVPVDACDRVLHALALAGAGKVGEYSACSFITTGTGRFTASDAASPAIGLAGEATTVEEVCIQTWCKRDQSRAVMSAIRAAHPYEEPVIYLIPLLDETDL